MIPFLTMLAYELMMFLLKKLKYIKYIYSNNNSTLNNHLIFSYTPILPSR